MTVCPAASPPPKCHHLELTFPVPFVLVATIMRERAMNAVSRAGHWEADRLWTWFDGEPSLRVAIVTGQGRRAFSAGADLIEQRDMRSARACTDIALPPSGFLGLSRRMSKKVVIAAVNGYALGGGFEIALSCDMVVASPTATSGLPEAKRGLYAAAGGLARVVRIFGMQLAGEMALAGRTLSAQETQHFGFARLAASPDSLMPETIALAGDVASISPDAAVVTKAGLREAWETASVERASQLIDARYAQDLFTGENFLIGLAAFAKKTEPEWVSSKL